MPRAGVAGGEMLEKTEIIVAAFYKFVGLQHYRKLKAPLLKLCVDQQIMGSILLGAEGINGTVAGSRIGINSLLDFFNSEPCLDRLEYKESITDFYPFYRMKVRFKKEIVSLGRKDATPDQAVGAYVQPEDWNLVITRPDVLTLDVRNDYEIELGSFQNATNPHTATFRDFPEYVSDHLDPQKNSEIAMYCTGGIRCEKASSYMLAQGHKKIYHLKGGILNYLKTIPLEQSLWQGECFVFDQRVSVNHHLQKGNNRLCYGCQRPVTKEQQLSDQYLEGIHCPHCVGSLSEQKRTRLEQRQRQVMLSKSRNECHIGSPIAKGNR